MGWAKSELPRGGAAGRVRALSEFVRDRDGAGPTVLRTWRIRDGPEVGVGPWGGVSHGVRSEMAQVPAWGRVGDRHESELEGHCLGSGAWT